MKPPAPIRPPKTVSVGSPADDQLLPPRAFIILAICMAAAVFAVYAPSLDFSFILDDHRFTADPRIQSDGHLWEYFTNYVWAQFTGGPPSFYRPIFVLWMRITFILCDLSTWGWHFLSIVKHLAVSALLGWLSWSLLRDRVAVLLAAGLFALHPAQTESVAWVTVPDPLMSIGVLASLLLYVLYAARLNEKPSESARRKSKGKDPKPASLLLLIASAGAYLTSLLAKETAVVLPAIIFVLAAMHPELSHSTALSSKKAPEQKGRNSGARMLTALKQTVPYVVVTLLYVVLRLNALSGKIISSTQSLTTRTVILSWPVTLWFYVKVLLWPSHSRAFADLVLLDRLSMSRFFLPALAVLAVLAVLAAFVFWSYNNARGHRTQDSRGILQAVAIGTLLLLLPLLPALNLNALNPGDFLHGRYTYLPLAGLMLLVGTAWRLGSSARIPILVCGIALAVVFATLTVFQERQWKDDLTLFAVSHQLAPNNRPVAKNLADAHVQQGLQLSEQGRCSEAVPIFEQILSEFPEDWYAWAALGGCQAQMNNLAKAEESLHKAADLSKDRRTIEVWQRLRSDMGLPPASVRQ